MKTRCYNLKDKHYKDYGGRGIKVCEEWLNDSRKFIKWSLENGYKKELQIDRIDNNGNYSPDNCRWVTPKENSRNKRNIVTDFKNGTRLCKKCKKRKKLSEFTTNKSIKKVYVCRVCKCDNPLT